ncbi:MAG: hypothetical protein V4636_01040 [Pseudomonadota bacterium]
MTKLKSQRWRRSWEVVGAAAEIGEWLYMLPLLIFVVVVPVWWGYSFVRDHLLISGAAAATLAVASAVYIARRTRRQ